MTRNNGESRSTTAGPPPRCRSHSWALNATMRTRSVTLVTSWWVVGLWGALGVATGALSLVALLHPAWYVRYSYIYAQEAEAVSFQVMVSSVGPLGFCRLESVDTSQKPSSDTSEDNPDETRTSTTLQAETTTTTITTPLVATTKMTTPFIDTTTTTTRQPHTTATTTRRTTTTTITTMTPRKTEKDPTTDWPLGNTTPPELTHKYTTDKGTRQKEFLPIYTTPGKLGIPEPTNVTTAPGYAEGEKHENSTAASTAIGSENSPQPTEAHSSNAPIPEQATQAFPTSKHTIKAHTQPQKPTHTGANNNRTGQEFVTRVPENQESYDESTQPYSVAGSKIPRYPTTTVSPSFTTSLPNRLAQDRRRTTSSAELTTKQTGGSDEEGTDSDGRGWEWKSVDKGVTDGFRDNNKILFSSTPSSTEEEEETKEEEEDARGNMTHDGLTEPEISEKRGQQVERVIENGVGSGRRQGSGGNMPGERMEEREKMGRRGEDREKAQVKADDKRRGRGEKRKKVHEERPAGAGKSERRGGKESGEVLERGNEEERKEAKERRKNGREKLPKQRRIGLGESEKEGGDRESKLEDGNERRNEERRKLPEEEETEQGKELENERELETSNETERRKEERRKEVPEVGMSERKEEEGNLERGGEGERISEKEERKLNSRRRFNTLGVGPGERRRGGEGGGRGGGGGGNRTGRRRKKKRGRKRKKWKNRRGNDSRTLESRTEHNGERKGVAQDGKTHKSKTEHTHSRETARLTRGDGRRTHELRREHTHNGENGRLGRRKDSRTHELKTEHTSNWETEKLAREDSRAHESRTEQNRGTEGQAKKDNRRTHESKTEHSEEAERLGAEEGMERLYRGILSDKRFRRNVKSSTEMQMESEAQQQDAVQRESYNPRPPILRCSGVGGGVGAGSSSVWALVGVVYGVAGVVQACVGVGALSLPLTHTQARRYWIAMWLGNVQVAVVMSQAVALVLFPLGLGSSLARGECGGSSSVYWPGECTFGWSYMLAVVATILAAYCPCLARLTVFRRLAFREWDSLNFF